MEVIKKGNKWSKQITCRGCDAVLKIGEDDILYKVTDEDARRQETSLDIKGTFYVECVECGQELNIKDKDIPASLQTRIRSIK